MISSPAKISIPANSAARKNFLPTSVDFAAREEVIGRLEADYDQSLEQLDELNARLESCLAFLTGKPAAVAKASEPESNALREAA